jgi:hypothetical protein
MIWAPIALQESEPNLCWRGVEGGEHKGTHKGTTAINAGSTSDIERVSLAVIFQRSGPGESGYKTD